jgi:DNA-binding MarR family transcriptional regulator
MMEPTDRVHLQISFEQREFPKLDYSAKQIVGRIIRLQDIFRQDFERVAGNFGANPTEIGVLTVLRAQGSPYTLSPNAINQLRFNTVSSGGLTNILHGLEKRGFVERLPDPSDGRGVLIRLTPRALDFVDRVIEARVAQERRWMAALDAKERATLEALLRKLLVSLEPVTAPIAAVLHANAESRHAAGRKSVVKKLGRRRRAANR